jgi:hypothetical protein
MRPLLIGRIERAQIARAIRKASAKPLSLEAITAVPGFEGDKAHYKLEDRKGTPSRDDCITVNVLLPRGYRVALTFEEQPLGLCKHLSISVDALGDLPNPHAVAWICHEYGMRFPPVGKIWLEEFRRGHSAVNIIDLIGEPPDAGKVLGAGRRTPSGGG